MTGTAWKRAGMLWFVAVSAGLAGCSSGEPKSNLTLVVDGATVRSNAQTVLRRDPQAGAARIWHKLDASGDNTDRYEMELLLDLGYFETTVDLPVTLTFNGTVTGESTGTRSFVPQFAPGAGSDARVLGAFLLHEREGGNAAPGTFRYDVSGKITLDELTWEVSPSFKVPTLHATVELATNGGMPPEAPAGSVQAKVTGTFSGYPDSAGWL